MAKTIANFLVGIGYETDKQSIKKVESSFDGIKSKALQLGAVVSGAFGIKALTTDFADARNELSRFGEAFSVDPTEILALGTAIETQGGTLESLLGQLESIERARARLLVGDVGFFAPAGKAGLDPNAIIDAENATEAYLGLADAFEKMTSQQRLNAADALGLDRSSILLLSKGREEVELLVDKFSEIRPVTERSTEAASEFNDQWVEMKANVSGVADVISEKILPDVTKGIGLFNELIGLDREGLRTTVGAVTTTAASTGSIPAVAAVAIKSIFGGDQTEQPTPEGTTDFFQGMTPSEDKALAESFIYKPEQQRNDATGQALQQTPQAPTQQNIKVTLELDGNVLDKRTMKVVDGMAQTALDDITSSTRG